MLPQKHSSTSMVEEAYGHVQGASLKPYAASLIRGFLTPRSPEMEGMMKSCFMMALALVFITTTAHSSAKSSTIRQLAGRAAQVHDDLMTTGKVISDSLVSQNQSGGGINEYEEIELTCLGNLQDASQRLSGDLKTLLVSVALADLAKLSFDRDSADEFSKLAADNIEATLPALRSLANSSASCSNSDVIAKKTQMVLDLIADTDVEMREFSLKMGHSRYSH
ncbi:MAG TPA: hypothetical protein VGT78_09380 [Rhizomicrobium sp.]|nr:hypothetical protein [Rhizomicrobium sp.]